MLYKKCFKFNSIRVSVRSQNPENARKGFEGGANFSQFLLISDQTLNPVVLQSKDKM